MSGGCSNLKDVRPQEWGDYGPAIARWEAVLGRPAPAPTETTAKGTQRLSPRFVEFLMGLPEGHVVDVPGLTRNHCLKALGNGVVPQQAAAATRAFLADLTHLTKEAA
jgi:DNA (cytosine-5)-methyltransferase 1